MKINPHHRLLRLLLGWIRGLSRRLRRALARGLLTYLSVRSILDGLFWVRDMAGRFDRQQYLPTGVTTKASDNYENNKMKNTNAMNNTTSVSNVNSIDDVNAMTDIALKSSRSINEIILHCSATREGQDFSAADIRRWHLQRGFNDIGYHFVVRRDGTVERGRDINRAGAHCLNHNRRSIGVCYVGGLDSTGRPKDTRTPQQRDSLKALVGRLCSNHPHATVHGHREFAAKACPCFDAAAEYSSLSEASRARH